MLAIIWPTVALVGWTFVVLIWMAASRGAHVGRNPPTPADLENSETVARYFRPVELPANNYGNLLELPVLYYALVPLLLVTGEVSRVQAALAWAFVAVRVAHSFVHIVVRKVPVRTILFLLSALVLLAMWVLFVVHLPHGE